jgi:hypothetical protein
MSLARSSLTFPTGIKYPVIRGSSEIALRQLTWRGSFLGPRRATRERAKVWESERAISCWTTPPAAATWPTQSLTNLEFTYAIHHRGTNR